MSLGREDILRELELLPVWRLRTPIAESPLPAIPLPAVTDISLKEEAAQTLPEATGAEPVTEMRAESSPALISGAAENAELETTAAPLIQSPWFLMCPQVDEPAAQQLLENIVRALKLPPEELHVSHQSLTFAQVKSQFAILFGLEVANAFLGTNHTDLASIRGKLLTHAEMRYVITHHPSAMLEQPLLKKEVWHDLCLLLAEK